MESIIEKSKRFLIENPEYEQVVIDWIDFGDKANYHKITGTNMDRYPLSRYKIILASTEQLLVEANIKTPSEMILNRETSFPNSDIPLLTSTTSRTDTSGTYGEKIFPVIIPKGTPIFFISAINLNEGRKLEETEEEFLIGPVKTKLINNVIHVSYQ